MFTGIIRVIGTVKDIINNGAILRYCVAFPHKELETGASVSVSGVCQTVVDIEEGGVWFEAIEETLQRTIFDSLHIGQQLNIERAAKIGDEIGGHLLSGHVYSTTALANIEGNIYTFQLPFHMRKYFFSKGYIAIDGISLTLVDVTQDHFTTHLIPETLKRTTLGHKCVGDRVNFEIDALTQATVETVERLTKMPMQNQSH